MGMPCDGAGLGANELSSCPPMPMFSCLPFAALVARGLAFQLLPEQEDE